MITDKPTGEEKRSDVLLPLILEIIQGRGESLQFPVRIRSLSARGVILTTGQTPGDLNLEGSVGRESVIYLPTGEVPEIRGSLLWARPRDQNEHEVVFGIELSSSNVKVRRAREEQLLDYPEDLKNLWDHWDAVHEEHELFSGSPRVHQEGPQGLRSETTMERSKPVAPQEQRAAPSYDNTTYLVGIGAVLAGLSIYFLAPESYRLFGVILAVYGSLTIAGKSVWSLLQNRT